MENTGWYVAIMAGVASVTALSSQFRSVMSRILSIVIVHVYVSKTSTGQQPGIDAVIYYANNNLKKIKSGIMTFSGDKLFVRPANRKQVIAYEEIVSSGGFFWYGWIPLIITLEETPTKNTSYVQTRLSIKTIRFLFDPDKFMMEAVDAFNDGVISKFHEFDVEYVSGSVGNNFKKNNQPILVTDGAQKAISEGTGRLLFWKQKDIGRARVDGNPLDYVALSTDMLKVISNVDFWIKNEKWYRDHGVPWNLNLLFLGGPGTGKSTLAKALAEKYNIPVMSVDLSTMTNNDLREMWARASTRVPQMIICEDFDTVFNGRENITAKDKLTPGVTFDCFINCLDGVGRTDGILFIITTNKPETMDEALAKAGKEVTRPGRIDFIVNFPKLNKEGLEKICRRVLKENPELWESTIKAGFENNDSGAQFQLRCQQIAKELVLKWD